MKLYAVCVMAGLMIDNAPYPRRWTPISKVAHLPLARRREFGYVPAVFTSRVKAEKWLLAAQGKLAAGIAYNIIDFDSDLIEV